MRKSSELVILESSLKNSDVHKVMTIALNFPCSLNELESYKQRQEDLLRKKYPIGTITHRLVRPYALDPQEEKNGQYRTI